MAARSYCKSYASELPTQMRVKEIPVGLPAVIHGSRYRSASQHHLADHELTVIFSDRAGRLLEAGIWQVGAFGPFPSFPPGEFARCSFPFKLGGQAAALPRGIGRGLI